MGASRWRIIRPLLAEGILLTGVAAAVALLSTAWIGPMLGELRLPGVPAAVDLHLVPDWRVFVLTVVVVLGSTTVSSLGPALRVSAGLSIVETLKTDSRASAAGGATTWRRLLTAGQAATAMLLLVVAGLALRSLLAVTRVDPGFETRGVAVASVAPALVGRDRDEAYGYLSRAAAAVRELPDVEAAGWIQPVPLSLSVRLTRLRLSGHDGAAPHELPLVRLVMRQALVPVAVGVVLGLLVALGATRVLTALLYGVSPHDPATLAAAALTLLATTAAAGAGPAWRATRTNLMRSLQAG